MQPIKQRFAPQAVAAAHRQLEQFVTANSDIKLALLTSGDGFEIAAHPALPAAQRIAAMTSSLQALSEAIAREAGLGRSRNLVVETDNGTIVVQGMANARMSLAVVASGSEILGRLLWATRTCCAELENSLRD